MVRKVILDVDTGIDDALAILLALASPELEVVGVTCVAGNITLDHVVRNTLAVLEVAGGHIPVAVGARKPLVAPLTTATYFHGANGIGGIQLPEPASEPIDVDAASYLVQRAREQPGEIFLVPTGPLTNVALAILKDADFVTNLAGITVMGGAVAHPGNAKGAAEANFRNDPEAAAVVVAAGGVRLVDLGITSTAELPMERLAPAARRQLTPPAKLALDLLDFYGPMYVAAGARGAVLHDPLAVALVAQPDLAIFKPLHLEVETAGNVSRGASVGSFDETVSIVEPADDHLDVVGLAPRPFNATVPRDLDSAAFLDLFMRRLGLGPT
ncbi:MAG: nucleoside hydrolase [Chloroflexota bacterium]